MLHVIIHRGLVLIAWLTSLALLCLGLAILSALFIHELVGLCMKTCMCSSRAAVVLRWLAAVLSSL